MSALSSKKISEVIFWNVWEPSVSMETAAQHKQMLIRSPDVKRKAQRKCFPRGKSWTEGLLWWVYVGTHSDHWRIQPSQRIAEQLLYLSEETGHIPVCTSTFDSFPVEPQYIYSASTEHYKDQVFYFCWTLPEQISPLHCKGIICVHNGYVFWLVLSVLLCGC